MRRLPTIGLEDLLRLCDKPTHEGGLCWPAEKVRAVWLEHASEDERVTALGILTAEEIDTKAALWVAAHLYPVGFLSWLPCHLGRDMDSAIEEHLRQRLGRGVWSVEVRAELVRRLEEWRT